MGGWLSLLASPWFPYYHGYYAVKDATFSTSQRQRQQTINRTNADQERVIPTRCVGEESRVNVKCTYFSQGISQKNDVKFELILNM